MNSLKLQTLNREISPSAEELHNQFTFYGGCARTVYGACTAGLVQMRMVELESAINKMSMESLQKVQSKTFEDPWIDAVPSMLFIIRPSKDCRSRAHYDVASKFILKLLMERFAKSFDVFAGTMTRILKGVGRMGASRGMVFEVVCHQTLNGTSETVRMKPMEFTSHDKNNIARADHQQGFTKTLQLQKKQVVHFGKELFTISSSSLDYYMPKATNHPTFDSILVSGGELYVFQFTVGSIHGASNDGLVMLNKCAAAIPKRWNFVCVVPESQELNLRIPNEHVDRFQRSFNFYFLEIPDIQIHMDELIVSSE